MYFLENPPQKTFRIQGDTPYLRHPSERHIAGLVLKEPGTFFVMKPEYGEAFDKDFVNALVDKIEVNDDDPEDVRRMKEEVELVKKEIAAVCRKEGKTPSEVMNEQAAAMFELGRYQRDLEAELDEIEANVHPIWELKDVESVSLPNPAGDFKNHKGDVGGAIVDSDSLPALLLAPEEGWAVVNVAALSKGYPLADVLASRVRKELLRDFALAGGCAFMSRSQIVLRGDMRSPRDLESIQEVSYGVEALMTLEWMLPYYAVMPWRQATYKKACREGWAPAPTNDVQKAIWDKVHAMPTEPIKIKPEEKKTEK